MTVIELIEKLQYLLDNNYLKENDVVLLLGTGSVKTDYISSVCMPKVIPDINPSKENKGYCHIGFCDGISQRKVD
jgi:hypothetical protein